MKANKLLIKSGLLLSILASAGFAALPVVAAETPSTAPSAQTSPSAAPAANGRQTDDDAAEFGKLDKNKDGALDKTEAILEPRLLTNFDAADTNKDGKVDKNEWAAFQKNKALVIKK